MKKFVYIILGLIGFILAIGTVGAADQEAISFNRLVIQCLISSALVGISFFGISLEEKREANRRYKRGSRKNF